MKLKLDENLNERGIALLAAAGHEVSTVVLQKMQAASDAEVIEVCRKEGRALVTLDLDFANPNSLSPQPVSGHCGAAPAKESLCGRLALCHPRLG